MLSPGMHWGWYCDWACMIWQTADSGPSLPWGINEWGEKGSGEIEITAGKRPERWFVKGRKPNFRNTHRYMQYAVSEKLVEMHVCKCKSEKIQGQRARFLVYLQICCVLHVVVCYKYIVFRDYSKKCFLKKMFQFVLFLHTEMILLVGVHNFLKNKLINCT